MLRKLFHNTDRPSVRCEAVGARDSGCTAGPVGGHLKYWRFRVVLLILGTCALQAGAQAPPSNLYVFPMFVNGGVPGAASFRSTLRIASTTTTNPVNCTLSQRNTNASLTGASGYMYITSVVTSDFSPLSVTPIQQPLGLSTEIVRSSGQPPLKNGYAE